MLRAKGQTFQILECRMFVVSSHALGLHADDHAGCDPQILPSPMTL